jgi:hypothetical protein
MDARHARGVELGLDPMAQATLHVGPERSHEAIPPSYPGAMKNATMSQLSWVDMKQIFQPNGLHFNAFKTAGHVLQIRSLNLSRFVEGQNDQNI